MIIIWNKTLNLIPIYKLNRIYLLDNLMSKAMINLVNICYPSYVTVQIHRTYLYFVQILV